MNRFSLLPPVVKNLLIINGIMFLATLALRQRGVELTGVLGLYYFDSPLFKPYQILTHMFMHANLAHIFFNMFAVWMFGSRLEMVWGGQRFLIFYLITGLGAALLHQGWHAWELYELTGSIRPVGHEIPIEQIRQSAIDILRTPVVGASGALFGVLGGFAMLFPNTELMLIFLPIPIKAKYFVLFYGLAELFMGMSSLNTGIAHFAHLGGLIFGVILVKIWNKTNRNSFW
jgi:membrane associated rhomboid family serine protease